MGNKSFESTSSTKKKRDSRNWKTSGEKRDASPSPVDVEQPQPRWEREPEPAPPVYNLNYVTKPPRRCGVYIGAHWIAVFAVFFLILLFINMSYTTIGLYNSLPDRLKSPNYPQREFLPMAYPNPWNQFGRFGQPGSGFSGSESDGGPRVDIIAQHSSVSIPSSTVIVSKTTTIVTATPAPPSNAQVGPDLEGAPTSTASLSSITSTSTQSSSSQAPIRSTTQTATQTSMQTSISNPLPSGARNPAEENHREPFTSTS